MSNQYEIEIKSLLGNKENANLLREKITKNGWVLIGSHKQLNHYFKISDVVKFRESFSQLINESKRNLFNKILKEGNDFSVRTREANGKVLLVVKASIGDDTSSNGVSRMEFESEMDMSLDKLDKHLLNAGFEYQAKWSREREEYKLDDTNICIDKNAGYGYLVEFEKVVTDRTLVDAVRQELLGVMRKFEVEELSQNRLERMFAHYNKNWQEYYGTDKVFNIK